MLLRSSETCLLSPEYTAELRQRRRPAVAPLTLLTLAFSATFQGVRSALSSDGRGDHRRTATGASPTRDGPPVGAWSDSEHEINASSVVTLVYTIAAVCKTIKKNESRNTNSRIALGGERVVRVAARPGRRRRRAPVRSASTNL